jgi:hypothetical protein
VDQVATQDLGRPMTLGQPSQLPRVYRDIVSAVGSVPGVERAALSMEGPLARPALTDVARPESANRTSQAAIQPVTAGWFEATDLPIVAGSAFAEDEWRPGMTPVPVVVTSALARRIFGPVEPVGRSLLLRLGLGSMEEGRIVGVSGNMRLPDAPDRDLKAFFVPLASFSYATGVTLVVRTRLLDRGVMEGVQQALDRVLPSPVPPDLAPVTAGYAQLFAAQRSLSRLLQLLAALAALLAAVGLYSVIGFAVAQRRREFGIHVALGADAGRIARLVLGDAAYIVGVGSGAGLLGAYLLSILLANRLYGVAQVDPLSYAGAVGLFATVAALACWIPTRAAMRANPVDTLRDA